MPRLTAAVVRGLAASAAALVLLAGCTAVTSQPAAVAPAPVPSATPTPSPTTTPSSGTTDPAIPQVVATVPPIAPAPAPPARLAVDWAGIDVPVEAKGVDARGEMDLPADPKIAGWYRFSAAPSASSGTTVLGAHVDAVGYGIGPFSHLVDVPKGTRITLTDTDGSRKVFAVDSATMITKTAVPWKSIFDTSGARRLVLVTCGGEFDYRTHHYLSNLVITASPV